MLYMSVAPYTVMPTGPINWLPKVAPYSYLDYTEDLSSAITNPYTGVVDQLTTMSLSVKPSGTGELVVSRLSLDTTGTLATWWMAGGVAGRTYILDLQGTSSTGRVYQWTFGVIVDPVYAQYPLPLPPVPGFGTPIFWYLVLPPPSPALFFNYALNFGAWPFGCGVIGPITPITPTETVPALIFDNPLNFGAWPFGCQVTGPVTPIPPPVATHPALIFTDPLNFGAWPFGCQVIGPISPVVPTTPYPALIFTTSLNFGAWPFGCQVIGPAVPVSSMTWNSSSTSTATMTLTGSSPPIPALFFNTPANFGAWPFGCQVVGPVH